MSRIATAVIFLVTILAAVGVGADAPPVFGVGIEQHGVEIPIVDHVVRLDRGPFTLVLIYPEYMGVLANFSLSPTLVCGMATGKTFDEILEEPGMFMGVAEESGNPKRAVFVDNAAPHYLYVEENDDRFGNVIVTHDSVVGRRVIAAVRAIGGNLVPIEQTGFHRLYIVLVHADWGPNWERITLQQEYLTVIFLESDS